MNEENQNKKKFEDYTFEETKAWIKAMEKVYEPFIEPGDYRYDEYTGKKMVWQEDGFWKAEEE